MNLDTARYRADWDNLSADARDLLEEVERLQADEDESDQVRAKMAALLTGVADALKGKPKPMQAHDWADLPALARDAALGLPRVKVEREDVDTGEPLKADQYRTIKPNPRTTVTIRLRDREYRFKAIAWECSLQSLPEGWLQ